MNVELLDHMGSDLSVCNAARVSFAKETSLVEGKIEDRDQRLIRYLARHNHWTPFAHTSLTFRISCPIFVARQLAKHQIGLVINEVSRRYVDTPPQFFTPDIWRSRAESVKQGSSLDAVDTSATLSLTYAKYLKTCRDMYAELLEEGVCPEQARMVLPQSMLTEFIWTGSLAAFARVCKLRLDPHTQLETRLVAQRIDEQIKGLGKFEHSWQALMEPAHAV